MIGCDTPYYYGKIKRKYKKQKRYRKRYFKKRKTRYYKKRGYKKPNKPTFRRKKLNPKECRCYYCKEIGHLANRCPKKFNNNKKMIEFDEDLDNMIQQGEFIQINDFNLDSDESIFILTDTENSAISFNLENPDE